MKPFDFPEALLGQSHTISWWAHVYDPAGGEVYAPVEDGSVTLSGRDRGRTRGDVTLVDTAGRLWDPSGLTGASPYGGHVEVCAQIGEEECFVASGLILDVGRERPGGTIRVAFVDYGQAVVWDQFGWPVGFHEASPLVSGLQDLFVSCAVTATIADPGIPATLGGTFLEESSREGAVSTICDNAGVVAWVDEHRRLRVQVAAVSAATPAVYTLHDGPNGTVTRESHGLSRDGVASWVVVTGERPQDAENPAIGNAYQTTGPTNVAGPYGRVVIRENRPVLATNAECDLAAATILRQRSRLVRNMQLDAVAHPCLEPGDRIDVSLSGNTFPLILEEVRYDIGPDAMNCRLVEATS